jgi:hypothetical protein
MQAIDLEISSALIQQRARDHGGQPFNVEWHGYLLVPESRDYRFGVRADDSAVLSIDGIPVASSQTPRGGSPIRFNRGLHRFQLRYTDIGGQQSLTFMGEPSGPFAHFPSCSCGLPSSRCASAQARPAFAATSHGSGWAGHGHSWQVF